MADKRDFVIENGVLTKYNGPGGDVVIPEGVREIGKSAFLACEGLTSIVLPESVREISGWAFAGCSGLTAAAIAEGVQTIGALAFHSCTSLTSITIPKSVQTIGELAFEDCRSLTSVTILTGVKEIGHRAFNGCGSLDSVVILASVRSIRGGAFSCCPAALFAPHVPLTVFEHEDKRAALRGFARLYVENVEIDETVRTSYLKYTKRYKEKLCPLAIQYTELLRLMAAEEILTREDVYRLLEECDKQRNPAAKAAVLEAVCQNFRPADPTQEYKL